LDGSIMGNAVFSIVSAVLDIFHPFWVDGLTQSRLVH
jgi:hypothetical protein